MSLGSTLKKGLKKSWSLNPANPKFFKNGLGMAGLTGMGGDDPGERQLAQIIGTLNQAKDESNIGFAQADERLRRQIPIVQRAYKKQGENLRYLADATKRSVLDREGSNLQRAGGALADRGLLSSNVAGLAARGVRGDTTRSLNEIDRLFSDRFGDLATGEADALAGIERQSSNLAAQGVGARNSLYGAMADAYAGQQFQPKKDLWDVIGAAAPIIGTFAGL